MITFDLMAHINSNGLFLFLILFLGMLPLRVLTQPPVHAENREQFLPFPWAGGLDACQFGEIDLDSDGHADLVVFDRRGNRLLCFLNDGIEGEVSFTYVPEFEKDFPKIYEWFVLADFDHDGRPDIFTYSPGWAGMQVYRNTGTQRLSFQRIVYPYLKSFQGGGYVNIFSTNADYPVIVDIDGDGDLDILTFWALGTFLELHTNQSIEKYGHADSLDFVKTDYCWGRIAEHEENNLIYLDTCLFPQPTFRHERQTRHRGATMLAFDANGNGLYDLLIGDVDYPNLNLLTNGGSTENALIIAQDQTFPSNSTSVKLFSMPQPALIDVNNDGIRDLIVSPFDPSPIVSENKNSVWLYLNEGTDELPHFVLYTQSFLQEGMIDFGSGTYPVFTDLDQDGHVDLLVGNYGYYSHSWYEGSILKSAFTGKLTWLRNVGSDENPVYEHANEDLGRLSSTGRTALTPAAADLDGDGKTELLVGNNLGTLIHLKQSEGGVWEIVSDFYQGIDAGEYSAPQLFDLDNDGTTDLILGSRNGRLAYYKGTTNGGEIIFQLVTDNLGNVDVTDYSVSYDGFSTPHFFLTPTGELMLLSGSEQGRFFLFDQIAGNLEGSFRETDILENLIDTVFSHHGTGIRTAAGITSGSDGTLIMAAGNYSGGLHLYNSNSEAVPGMSTKTNQNKLIVSPIPANEFIKIGFSGFSGAKWSIKILDVRGICYFEETISPDLSLQINTINWPKGIYLIIAGDDRQTTTNKIVVTN